MEPRQIENKQREIKSLTGLRGLAACPIVLYHTDLWRYVASGRLDTFLKHGNLAVDLFFILSGFVMAANYAERFRSNFTLKSHWTFLLLRIGRIYPLYLSITAVCLAFMYIGRSEVSVRTAVSNILLVQAWGIAPSIVGPGWSISTEFAAYLLFPCFLYFLVFSPWVRSWAFAVVAVLMLIFVALEPSSSLNQTTRMGPLDVYGVTIYPLLRCLAGFMLGLFAWRISTIPSVVRFAAEPLTAAGIAMSILLAMTVPAVDIIIVLLFVPFIIALATDKSSVARCLGSPAPYRLGLMSYSIYLVHAPLFDLQHPLVQILRDLSIPQARAIASALIILLVLGVSITTYCLVEKPGRDFVRAVIGSRVEVGNTRAPEPLSLGD